MGAVLKILSRPDIIPRALMGDPTALALVAIAGICFASDKIKKK